jgi:hypothetical protein
MFLICAKGF